MIDSYLEETKPAVTEKYEYEMNADSILLAYFQKCDKQDCEERKRFDTFSTEQFPQATKLWIETLKRKTKPEVTEL